MKMRVAVTLAIVFVPMVRIFYRRQRVNAARSRAG
jgi:hypothetical protein